MIVHAKVVSSYKTSLEDELKLEVGDVIRDVHMTGDKYWTGVMRGKRGHFPKDCVKLLLKGICVLFQYYYASHMFASNQLYLFCFVFFLCACMSIATILDKTVEKIAYLGGTFSKLRS